MASDGRKLPPWTPPLAQPDPQLPRLKIYNSLTRNKDDFVPVDPTREMVAWYACGPTVYDDAPLGHAKNYVSTDIIRLKMKDYFGFRIRFVMNTTFISDKIIPQARQQYLLPCFKQEHAAEDDSVSDSVSDSVLAEAKAAFRQWTRNKENTEPSPLANALTAKQGQTATVADLRLKIRTETVLSAAEALRAPGELPEFFAKTDDILLPYLDSLHGAEMDPNNHKIYLDLTQKFERRFFEGMNALNVPAPDQLTRVTETILSQKEWSAFSLYICFLLMQWQDAWTSGNIPVSSTRQRKQFRTNIRALVAQQAPAKRYTYHVRPAPRCTPLEPGHIYLEDRGNPQPALVRPLDRLFMEARAEQESAGKAKAKAKLEQEAKEVEREKELSERAKFDPRLMFMTYDKYLKWDENGIPTMDAAGNEVSESRRKKLAKEWEKQKKLHEEWLAKQQAA
ncbi:hypothetical protein S7711_04360 [Stachybotrys chartarum IBT 7711]|uniref:tRNA synthetases class I catalytic domain-containing protein n=1 Tax=Stachybotrys chartarum (strain CBS 109288 / IBT 7711) TaxID=1280523 RepID=A0A084AY72_STACB|nr:hypothetical protein S7711_04360 [Stachybotrys chartarum IBT 7711]